MTTHNTTSNAEAVDPHDSHGSAHAESVPAVLMTREEVRRCLGFDDAHAPGWVKAAHEYKISTFGSGNGQAVR